MPVKSEQDNCSFDSNPSLHTVGSNCIPAGGGLASFGPQWAECLALSGDPVDQPCGIQQRCCLIEQLLDVEGDFKAYDRVSACKIAVAALRHSTASPGTVDCRSYFSATLPPLSTSICTCLPFFCA